ncbi:hypothetical protein RUM43_003515 [Polyplax serrata]|uniref:Uncharacterized protein n=1 Tax=Polyplax serrata TaxID=468196 RepID=A0AAN8PPG6_POLSC
MYDNNEQDIWLKKQFSDKWNSAGPHLIRLKTFKRRIKRLSRNGFVKDGIVYIQQFAAEKRDVRQEGKKTVVPNEDGKQHEKQRGGMHQKLYLQSQRRRKKNNRHSNDSKGTGTRQEFDHKSDELRGRG